MICQNCGNNVGNRMSVCPYCKTHLDPAAAEHAARMSAPTNPLGSKPVRDVRHSGPNPYMEGKPAGGFLRVLKTLIGLLACAAIIAGVAYGTWKIGIWGGLEVPTGLIGMDGQVAEGVLSSHGFKVDIVEQMSADAAGEVLAVDPAEGERTGMDRAVTLTVGVPDPDAGKVAVPETSGSTLDEARAILEGAGFFLASEEVEADAPAGTVVSSNPAAGQLAEPGSTVTLGIAKQRMPGSLYDIAAYFGAPSDQVDSWLRGQGFAEPKTSDKDRDALYVGEGVTVGFSDAYPTSLLGVYTGGPEVIPTTLMADGFEPAAVRIVYSDPAATADEAGIAAIMEKFGLTGLEETKGGEAVSEEYGWDLYDQFFAFGSMDGRSWSIGIDPSAGEVRVSMFESEMDSDEVSASSAIDLSALANNLS